MTNLHNGNDTLSSHPSAESNWEAGVRRTTKDRRLLVLSPEPVMTGARAVDVNAWIRRKTDGWLDLQGGNLLKQRNDAIEPTFDLLFVLPQTRIGCTIGKRMLRPGDRQG